MLGNPIRVELNFLPSVSLCFSCSAACCQCWWWFFPQFYHIFQAEKPLDKDNRILWGHLGSTWTRLTGAWREMRTEAWIRVRFCHCCMQHPRLLPPLAPPLPLTFARRNWQISFQFSSIFFCLDTNLTNAKGDAKLQVPASCQRATPPPLRLPHAPLCPLSWQLATCAQS